MVAGTGSIPACFDVYCRCGHGDCMNKQLIRQLAITGGIYDCITDPYDKLNNGDPYSSVMVDLERFAEKIVRECAELTLDYKNDAYYNGWLDYRDEIKKHFGVEETK